MSEEKTFREAYGTLQKHAQTLRSQQEPDIDNLTTIVTESLRPTKAASSALRLSRKRSSGRLRTREMLGFLIAASGDH